MLISDPLNCCFCGEGVELIDYIEMELHVEGARNVVYLGCHRDHLKQHLMSNVVLPLQPLVAGVNELDDEGRLK